MTPTAVCYDLCAPDQCSSHAPNPPATSQTPDFSRHSTHFLPQQPCRRRRPAPLRSAAAATPSRAVPWSVTGLLPMTRAAPVRRCRRRQLRRRDIRSPTMIGRRADDPSSAGHGREDGVARARRLRARAERLIDDASLAVFYCGAGRTGQVAVQRLLLRNGEMFHIE